MFHGGVIMPLPNQDHKAHIENHIKFVQDNQKDMNDTQIKIFMTHVKMTGDIMSSVYAPLNQGMSPGMGMSAQSAGMGTLNSPVGMGGGIDGGGAPGEMGSLADAISAAGGRNAPQRNAR